MNVFTKQKAVLQQAKAYAWIQNDRKRCLHVLERKFNEKEKELRDVTKLFRRRLEWCRLTGEQYDPN